MKNFLYTILKQYILSTVISPLNIKIMPMIYIYMSANMTAEHYIFVQHK